MPTYRPRHIRDIPETISVHRAEKQVMLELRRWYERRGSSDAVQLLKDEDRLVEATRILIWAERRKEQATQVKP